MQAKVKIDSRYPTVLALSGREFTKGDWREVPVGFEAEALRNQYLEVRETVAVEKVLTAKEIKAAEKAAKAAKVVDIVDETLEDPVDETLEDPVLVVEEAAEAVEVVDIVDEALEDPVLVVEKAKLGHMFSRK